MTWFEYLTQNQSRLAVFLDRVQNDALEAEGCSIKLTLPDSACADWEEWLDLESGLVEDDYINWRNYP